MENNNSTNEYYQITDIKKQNRTKDASGDDPNNVFEMSPYWFNKYFVDNIYPELLKEAQNNLGAYSALDRWTKTKHKNMGCVFLILFLLACLFPPLIIVLLLVYIFQPKDARKTLFARSLRYIVFSHFNIRIVSGQNVFLFRAPDSVISQKIFFTELGDYRIEDSLAFTYKDLPIRIAEVAVIYKRRLRSATTVHRHILVGAKINKKFKGETFLYSKDKERPLSLTYIGLTDKHEQVSLEDVSFNDKFKVFSTDQIEARYLLTPAFMSRLLKYRNSHKNSLNIVFNNDISQVSNVFMDLVITEDFFEINKDPLGAKTYWDILQEIKELLEILDALKLDQNIGM